MKRAHPREYDMRVLMDLYNAGDLRQAEDKAREFVESFPAHVASHNVLCACLAGQKKFSEAEAGFRKVLAMRPEHTVTHNNLGVVLTELSKLEEALDSCRRAVELKPDYAEAHSNIGNILQKLGRQADAIESCERALAFNRQFGAAHNFLGNALRDVGRATEAVACYRNALRLMPGSAEITYNLGSALQIIEQDDEAIACFRAALQTSANFSDAHEKLGDALAVRGPLEKAINHYRKADTREAHAKVLECLYAQKSLNAFDEELKKLAHEDQHNIRAAAISAFAAQQRVTPDIFPYCKSPLEFISVVETGGGLEPFTVFATDVMEEAMRIPAVWQPEGKTTTKGFQSAGNLFAYKTPALMRLEAFIRKQVVRYRADHANITGGFLTQWPDKFKLSSWYVRLLQGGHQDAHIHPGGWLSGVLYLRVPPGLVGDEGSIEFGLHGYDYPVRRDDLPVVRIRPKPGQMIMFPSSLFHRTIPCTGDDERHCIAFDLEPLRG